MVQFISNIQQVLNSSQVKVPFKKNDCIKVNNASTCTNTEKAAYNSQHLQANFLTFKNNTSFTGLTKKFSKRAYSEDELEKIVANHKDATIGNLPYTWINKLAPGKKEEGCRDILQAFYQAGQILNNTMNIHCNPDAISNPGDMKKSSEIIDAAFKKHKIIDENEKVSLEYIDRGLSGAVYSFEVLGKKYIYKKFYDFKDPLLDEMYVLRREELRPYGHGALSEPNRASLIKKYESHSHFIKFFFANAKIRYMVCEFVDENSETPKKNIGTTFLNLKISDNHGGNYIVIFDPKTHRQVRIRIDYGGLEQIYKNINDTKEAIKTRKSIANIKDKDKRLDKWNEIYNKYKNSKNNENIMLGLLTITNLLNKPDAETCITNFYKNRKDKCFNLQEKRILTELINYINTDYQLDFIKTIVKDVDNSIKVKFVSILDDLEPKDRFEAFKVLFEGADDYIKSILTYKIGFLAPEDRFEAFKMLFDGADDSLKLALALRIDDLIPENRFEAFKMLFENASNPIKLRLVGRLPYLEPENHFEAFKILSEGADDSIKSRLISMLSELSILNRFDEFKILSEAANNIIKLKLVDKLRYLELENRFEAFKILCNNAEDSLKDELIQNLNLLDPQNRFEAFKMLSEGANNYLKNKLVFTVCDFKPENRVEAFEILFKNADNCVKYLLANKLYVLEPEDRFEAFKILFEQNNHPIKLELARNLHHLEPKNRFNAFMLLAKDANETLKKGLLKLINTGIIDKKYTSEANSLLNL